MSNFRRQAKRIPLRNVAFFQEGPGLRTRQWTTDGMKVINVTNIVGDGSVDVSNTDKFIALDEFETRYTHFAVEENDSVVASSGNTYGKVGRIRSEHLPLIMNTSVIRFHSLDKTVLDDDFLYAWLRSPEFVNQVEGFVTGGAQPNFGPTHLKRMSVTLPEIDLQKKIASIISSYDDLIENNRRRMTLLEDSARQLYREWFVRLRFPGHEYVRVINGIPEGWERKRIEAIADCVGGGTPSTTVPAYWEDGTITWVTPTDVTRNQHFALLDTEKKITEVGLNNSSAKLVPPHAVLMTSRASVGFFAIAGREVCTNQGFISIVPQDAVFSTFLLFQLTERVEEIRTMGSGSTYPEVSRGKFREFQVVIPPRRLVADYDEQATVFLRQIRVLKQQTQKLKAARDLLLPRLMSGEIV